jgi:hypothetical protein
VAILAAPQLHPALDRALELAARWGGTEGAEASLGRVLRRLASSEREEAWSGSTLSRTGFPVEIAFVAGDPSWRCTAEVAGPEVARRDRLPLALAIACEASELSGFELDAETAGLLDAAQGAGTLRYGAWLGVRQARGQAAAKVYAEVPAAAGPLLEAWERSRLGAPILPNRQVQLSMLGLQPGRTELYYGSLGLRPGEIATALARVGLAGRAPEVLDLLTEAYGRSLGRELPAADFGWSYALGPGGEPEAFTLYTFANALLGGDGRIRTAVLRLAAAHGWDLSLYEAISRPLAARRGALTHHGMLGIVVPAAGPLTLSLGLTPPLREGAA